MYETPSMVFVTTGSTRCVWDNSCGGCAIHAALETTLATATPTPTATKTRNISCEILDEHEAADLLGLNIFVFRQRSCGDLPGISRAGSQYFVTADFAHRLRQIRAGVPASSVWKDEYDATNRAVWEADKPNRDVIAAADAKCAADKAERLKVAQAAWNERQAREERNKAAMLAASGSRAT